MQVTLFSMISYTGRWAQRSFEAKVSVDWAYGNNHL